MTSESLGTPGIIPLHSLFIYDPSRAESTLEAFQSEHRANSGPSHLFGIFEFSEKGEAAEKFLASLITQLDTTHKGAPSDGTTEARFEYIITKINEWLHAHPRTKKPGTDDGRTPFLHALVGLLEGSELSFSGMGSMRGFILYPTHAPPYDESTIKMVGILEPTRTRASLFAQLLSGQLKADTTILFSTSTLCDVLSLEYLKKTLSKNDPSAAIIRLEGFLAQLSSHLPFAAFILGGVSPRAQSEVLSPTSSPTPAPSSRYKKIPSVMPFLTQGGKAIGSIVQSGVRTIYQWLLVMLRAVGNVVQKSGSTLWRVRAPREQKTRHTRTPYAESSHAWRNILIGVFVLFVVGSALFLRYERTAVLRNQKTTEALANAENSYQSALALLVTRQDKEARANFQEALRILQALEDPRTPEMATKAATLLTNIQEELKTMQHISVVENPIRAASWTETTFARPLFLFPVGSSFAVLSEKALWYKGNVKNIAVPENTRLTQASSLEGNSALISTEAKSFFALDATQGTLSSYQVDMSNIKTLDAWALYNKRLYIADSTAKQIWRLPTSSNGFGKGSSWLKDANLPQGIHSITLDGSIFALEGKGTLHKFDTGKKSEFLATIDPPLLQATKIWTSPTSAFLYILDPQGRRLVVVKKDEARMMIQYTSSLFTGLKDFNVDEKQKKISLLTSDGILEFAAEHIK